MTTVTKRISATAAGGATNRVPSFQGNSYRTWGESWGDSWAESWREFFPFATIGLTQRLSEAPAASATKRVTGI